MPRLCHIQDGDGDRAMVYLHADKPAGAERAKSNQSVSEREGVVVLMSTCALLLFTV